MLKAVWDGKSEGSLDSNFDCYIAEALLSEGRLVGNLEDVLKRYGVETVLELAEKQEEELSKLPKLRGLFYDIEMPLSRVLWGMERKGILLDTKELGRVGEEIDGLLVEVEKDINKETGGGVNINSSVQLGDFLADKVGIPLGKTKTGRYATNEGELSRFREQFSIIDSILSYRELTKLRSTYVESLIEKVDGEGRIHTTYNQVYVNTGRIASSNPNLQNIPVSSDMGRRIKSCFVASPGCVLVSFDYSQQELRVLAHLAGESELIKAFKEGEDVHTLTASKLFGVAYGEVSKEQRTVGKTINFGIIYGMSSYGMSAGLNIPQEEAELFIQQFYVSYPKIKGYYDGYLKGAQVNGFAETMLGRRRYVFEDPRRKFVSNAMRRVLMNYPIQGSAADLMKKGMVDVEEKILGKYEGVSLLLTIHDDLVFEVVDDEKRDEVVEAIRGVLCGVYELEVPLVVDVKVGRKWGELQGLGV